MSVLVLMRDGRRSRLLLNLGLLHLRARRHHVIAHTRRKVIMPIRSCLVRGKGQRGMDRERWGGHGGRRRRGSHDGRRLDHGGRRGLRMTRTSLRSARQRLDVDLAVMPLELLRGYVDGLVHISALGFGRRDGWLRLRLRLRVKPNGGLLRLPMLQCLDGRNLRRRRWWCCCCLVTRTMQWRHGRVAGRASRYMKRRRWHLVRVAGRVRRIRGMGYSVRRRGRGGRRVRHGVLFILGDAGGAESAGAEDGRRLRPSHMVVERIGEEEQSSKEEEQFKSSKDCRGNTAFPGPGHAAGVVVVSKVRAVAIVAYAAVDVLIARESSQAGKPKDRGNRVEGKRWHRMENATRPGERKSQRHNWNKGKDSRGQGKNESRPQLRGAE